MASEQGQTATPWALLALSLGFGVVQLDVTVVNVAVNRIGSSIGGGISDMQWVVSAYTVAFAAFILSAGAAGDRLGARRLFVAGFALFTGASAACAAAPSVAVLIAARAVQGLGAAVLVPCSLTLLNHTYTDPARRSWAIGWWAAGASAALAAGPVLGGVLIAAAGWRAIFLINLPLGAAAIWLTRRHVAETPPSGARGLDLPGQISGAAALASLAGATIEGGAHGFLSGGVLALYALSVAAVVSFVVVEERSDRPMLPLGLFGRPAFGVSAAMGLLVNVCFYGLIFVFSLWLQRLRGLSALGTGLAFLPMTAAIMLANVVAGRLAPRVAPTRLITAGLAVMAGACVALMTEAAGSSNWLLAVLMTGLGAGIGLLVPPLTGVLLSSVDRRRSGIASATLNSMRQTGSVIGVALFGSLLAGRGAVGSGTQVALGISIGLLLGAAGLAVWLEAAERAKSAAATGSGGVSASRSGVNCSRRPGRTHRAPGT